ncbi:hypothetical protein MLD38_031806 [Melastoma candidum]|uniref:Uncharacterized protein n=1 Tax=Melastoma candidum TaxID=119954 RepID=A0ACB9MQV5_9MYRT|nr:hypothetical protein MLD38_031806 [Melastoma candidum]
MSPSILPFFLHFVFTLCLNLPSSSQSRLPVVAPIYKDHTTSQYILPVDLATPPRPTNLLLDLGSLFSWINCYAPNNYTSSTYRNIPCNFTVCGAIDSFACGYCYDLPAGPTCSNNTCEYFPENPYSRTVGLENAVIDVLSLGSTVPSGPPESIPDFIFSCAKPDLLKNFAKGVSGLAAFGYSNESIPFQVSNGLSLPRIFAICLSGSRSPPGPVFLGSAGPYDFPPPGTDLSKGLIYTPILLDPYGDTVITYVRPSAEYFIGVSAIRVNSKNVPLNRTLLKIDPKTGYGGTRLSTIAKYTTLHPSIFKAVTEAFVQESSAMNLTITDPVEPFTICYPAENITATRVGPAVPTIDLVLQSSNVYWRIYGANSMVSVGRRKEYSCLGFVDGGPKARTSIVIGGYQMEDNLLQFDIEAMRLGFSSSVLARGTTCADYKF